MLISLFCCHRWRNKMQKMVSANSGTTQPTMVSEYINPVDKGESVINCKSYASSFIATSFQDRDQQSV